MPRAVPIAIALMLAASSAGCVRVAAHQRGTLARSAMQAPVWPERAAGDDHVYLVREGTGGATASGGGGCGCN